MSEYIVRIPSDMPYEIKAELYAWYVNSEPIVRCRDCKYYMHSSWHRCDLHSIAHEVEPDGFCAWGVRREDG